MTRTDTTCCNCGERASGKHSLPVNDNCDIVPSNYEGEWAGKPSCEHCYAIHRAIGSGDHGATGEMTHRVLDAHAAALESIKQELSDAHTALVAIVKIGQVAIDEITSV